MSERIKGTVRWYSLQGYGFIDPLGNVAEKGIYFHLSDVDDQRILKPGDTVTFEIAQVPKGQKCIKVSAVNTKEVIARVESNQ